jgi:hypothetical protein
MHVVPVPQAYFTGHDHNLEHLTPPGYNIIVTGAPPAESCCTQYIHS